MNHNISPPPNNMPSNFIDNDIIDHFLPAAKSKMDITGEKVNDQLPSLR